MGDAAEGTEHKPKLINSGWGNAEYPPALPIGCIERQGPYFLRSFLPDLSINGLGLRLYLVVAEGGCGSLQTGGRHPERLPRENRPFLVRAIQAASPQQLLFMFAYAVLAVNSAVQRLYIHRKSLSTSLPPLFEEFLSLTAAYTTHHESIIAPCSFTPPPVGKPRAQDAHSFT